MRPVLFGILLLTTVGCAKPEERLTVYPVAGQVFVNGRPAAGAGVFLHPQASEPRPPFNPRAAVKDDGSFTLTTYENGDGAPAGEYTVCIVWERKLTDDDQETVEGSVSLVPAKFSHPSSSPLRATVQPTSNQLPPYHLTK
jgi:hypothetical protein